MRYTHMSSMNELREKIGRFPRVKLAHLPTPLHEVPRFSRALGGPRIFIKRDDLTGLAFGGNKTRMFEFLLAKAKKEGADTVIGGAGVQSNYCRQLTAACNALGLEVHIVLRRIRGASDNAVQGNLLLDLIAGAHVHVIDADDQRQRKAIYELAEELKNKGKKPFVTRMAAQEDLIPDVVAYVDCFCEMQEQCEALDIQPTYLYLASYDSTQAGLEVGRVALDNPMKIRGIAPGVWGTSPDVLIARYANQVAQAIDISCEFSADNVYNTTAYVGKGYGIPTPASMEMLKLMARTEGLFLDPVYTSKAMSAVSDHIKKGELRRDDIVLFLHTGGTPALFAYIQELDPDELKHYIAFDDR
jgi:1-aminocyclopropane-1-carboxylate deaminase/D-cysteine desulfhydrase-like pyridoxal-dependent ACC family enzyme